MIRHESSAGMPPSAIGAAVLIAAIWGFNFVVIKVGVSAMPPLMLAALRFFFSALPAVFFVKRPRVALKTLATYGLLLGVGEFGFLFTAIRLGAPAGLSSILLQFQAFFTALLAALVLKEGLRAHNLVGMAVAAAGLAVFAFAAGGQTGGASGGGLSLDLLAMILAAALGWAGANVTTRKMPGVDALPLMVWSSLFSPLPLALLSLLFEGPGETARAFSQLSLTAVGALGYLVLFSTLLGYGLWNHLILRHGAARIAPFSLMVPVFGVLSAGLVLHERVGREDVAGTVLVLAGLLVHVFGGRLTAERTSRKPTR